MNARDKVRELFNRVSYLTLEEKKFIVENTIIEKFSKGTILLRQGQVPTKCFTVLEGCVREYTMSKGEEKTTGFFTEGDTIAPHTYHESGEPSDHFLECLENSTLSVTDKQFERLLLLSFPRLAEVMPEFMVEELKKAKSEWTRFITSSPEERYIDLMESRPSLFNRVAHHQIASYLGMQPQSLSRIRKRVFHKETQPLNGQSD
ncbi:MAG: Crp/Fnr family transcriptional regulator [Cytophagales bacterium]|nr:Crp/Fnr family transcriptional regulator [Cytophagales bacterium]